jgi:hypothetical protein
MLIRNKKGAIGATLTWIVATFIILFILIIFLVAVGVLSLKKGKIEIGSEVSLERELVLSEVSLAYLNSEIGGKKVKDFIGGNTEEKYKKLGEHSLDFFEKYDLLWKVYIFEPDKINPFVLTKKDWDKKKFICGPEEINMETIALDSRGDKYLIRMVKFLN